MAVDYISPSDFTIPDGPKDSFDTGYAGPSIIDIRGDVNESNILEDIHKGLKPKDGQSKTLPTLLLYDEVGLKMFERITYLTEYYLTNAEIEVLSTYADRIAERIPDNSIVLELGSGNLRKINLLLHALDRIGKHVDYYALDLDLTELQRTLAAVPKGTFKHVQCYGLHGTYDDGLVWLNRSEVSAKPKCILSMGSSIGNFEPVEVAPFLKAYATSLQNGDMMLIGIDKTNDPEKIYHAYNDKHGVTHDFILNGLAHANRLLGWKAFDPEVWKVHGEVDPVKGCHQAFVYPNKDVTFEDIHVAKNEKVRIEHSYKYSDDAAARLWKTIGVTPGTQWTNSANNYGLHMVSRTKVSFPTSPAHYASSSVPSFANWGELWAAWDTVSREMIPDAALHTKPIALRNDIIFYLGHIPVFLMIQLARETKQPPLEPKSFLNWFERGIDPDVDNPDECHWHSEAPDAWPPVTDILDYQSRVRDFVQKLYEDGTAERDRNVGRALWLGFEHEVMHLETLLYMLLQSDLTLPPPEVVRPDFESLAQNSRKAAKENKWFKIPAQDVRIGLDDLEDDLAARGHFGFDNEKPARSIHVPAFHAKARPITNGEYAEYMAKKGITELPTSWISLNNDRKSKIPTEPRVRVDSPYQSDDDSTKIPSFTANKAIRTVYGPVPLKHALDWPIFASYDELVGCAIYLGGRIPTFEEARSIYAFAETLKSQKEALKKHAIRIPAVNSHLVNDGVEETPPAAPATSTAGSHDEAGNLFIDLADTNTGFKYWHPTPVAHLGDTLAGQADLGGVWEWTSTTLAPHEGFAPMRMYPDYTADFHDGKHNVVLGGSWCTHPRVAGRRSFVNWYQRNYRFAWAGARIVRDA